MADVIQNYSSSDFHRLADFYGRTAKHATILGNSYTEFLIQKFKRPGYDPTKNLFVAEKKKKLIGYADLVYEEQIKRAIADIFVFSPYRHQGLGGELMDLLLRRSRDIQAATFHVNVPEFDQTASFFLSEQKFSFIRNFLTLKMDISKKLFLDWDFEHIVLKSFKTGEEEDLAALQNKIFSGSWGFCPNTVEETRYYLQLTGCRIKEVICIEDKGRKIGYVWHHKLPKTNGRRIHMFGVDPAFRGRGLGKKLIQTAIYQMGKLGIKTVELTVDSENVPAVSLYNSLGFKLESRSVWYEKPIT